MSTREEVMLLRKDKSAWVKAEVIPNHLLLNIGDYAEQATLVQMNPPIRQPEDNVALWAGLHDGIVDFMGTDHAPHSLAEKQQAFPSAPSGMPGIETALPLMLTAMKNGRCTLAELLKWMCVGPAEAYGIPNKGKLLEGWDADLILVDLDRTKVVRNETLQSKAGWSPYAGKTLTGWPVYTIVGGQVVYDQGRIRPNVRGRALTYKH
jgi:dihydroorotase